MTTEKINCPRCGSEMDWVIPDEMFSGLERSISIFRRMVICDKCAEKKRAEDARVAAELALADRMFRAPSIMKDAGVPESMINMQIPPCQRIADKVYESITKHKVAIVLGATGVGKTTGTAWALRKAFNEGVATRCKWHTGNTLKAAYALAKKRDGGDFGVTFFDDLFCCGVVVVDDIMGKGTVTDTWRECLWEFFDAMYQRKNRDAVIITGNLTKGSIEAIWENDAESGNAARRRLYEACGGNIIKPE